MKSIDEIEFAGHLISGGYGSSLTGQRLRSSPDVGVQEPCGVEFGDTDECANVVVQNDVDIKPAGDPSILA